MQETFMRAAIGLAVTCVEQGAGGPFGAVVVQKGDIIGRGSNVVTSSNDPTAHAEIVAIRQACSSLGTFRLSGCEIYASCEPCPMCLAAIYWARIDRVYYASTRADAAATGFDDALLYREISSPIQERRLPMIQLLDAEARAPLEAWKKAPNKIAY